MLLGFEMGIYKCCGIKSNKMKILILLTFIVVYFTGYCQISLQKKAINNKKLFYYGFEYYNEDSIVCSSNIDSTLNREIFLKVDKWPFFGAKKTDLMNYIEQNLNYPDFQSDISETVFVGFIVEENGKISNIKIVRGIDPIIDNEAIKVIQKMPDWNPGECAGIKVPVHIIIPVRFSLK